MWKGERSVTTETLEGSQELVGSGACCQQGVTCSNKALTHKAGCHIGVDENSGLLHHEVPGMEKVHH